MSISSLMNQRITVYPKTSYSASGREVLGTGSVEIGRLTEKTKSIMMPNGQIKKLHATAIFRPCTTIEINDKISYNGTTYKVFDKKEPRDGSGEIHHITVALEKWELT